jgi:hypothetical protein
MIRYLIYIELLVYSQVIKVTTGQRPITSIHNSIYIYVKTVYDMYYKN